MAEITRLSLGLIDAYLLAEGVRMAVASKGRRMAAATLTALIDGRADATAIDCAVASGAAKDAVYLGWRCADEGRS